MVVDNPVVALDGILSSHPVAAHGDPLSRHCDELLSLIKTIKLIQASKANTGSHADACEQYNNAALESILQLWNSKHQTSFSSQVDLNTNPQINEAIKE
jgi:hypothetical protein